MRAAGVEPAPVYTDQILNLTRLPNSAMPLQKLEMTGLEPAPVKNRSDFESDASTYSATSFVPSFTISLLF